MRPWAGVQIVVTDQVHPRLDGPDLQRRIAIVGDPERVPVVGEDQVEGAVGVTVKRPDGARAVDGVGVVERIEHHFPARTLARRRSQRLLLVQNGRRDAGIIYAAPSAAREHVLTCAHVGPVVPVPTRRQGGPPAQLIAVPGDQERPFVVRVEADQIGTHDPQMGPSIWFVTAGLPSRGSGRFVERLHPAPAMRFPRRRRVRLRIVEGCESR